MGTTLRAFFLVFIWAGIMAMQYNFDLDNTTTRRVKHALELAVHDASLEINKAALAEGNIVFNTAQAEQKFKLSLRENLILDASLHPLDGSLLQEEVKIMHLEYIDDSNTGVFPFNYTHDRYEIFDTVRGPSIVAVIETVSPRYFKGDPMTIRQSVVYEYKEY